MASAFGLAWKFREMAKARIEQSLRRTQSGSDFERGFAEGLRLAAAELEMSVREKIARRRQRVA